MIIEDIITQHAEEVSFLWLLRDLAIRAPHYSLLELAELDDRLEAHIDGLRIAGEGGWMICQEQLGWEEVAELFAAAFLAFESRDDARIQIVLEGGVPHRNYPAALSLPWAGSHTSKPKGILNSSSPLPLQTCAVLALRHVQCTVRIPDVS